MGKKGNWLSTLKRVLIPSSKEKVVHESEKKAVKERKKWGVGKLRPGETASLIPLYREPSSIEKILGEAEKEHHQISHSLPSREQQKTHAVASREKPQTHPLSSGVHHHKATATVYHPRNNYHIAAIKIQTAYRGYMARSNFRALKGLMRLQGLVRGQSVRRQTMNAMRHMQLLVKIRSQIHSRRIQMMENHAFQRHNLLNRDKIEEANLGKQITTELDEADYREEWDDSMLTKGEVEARMQRRVDAIIRRERALAYSYPHQLWRNSPKPTGNALMEIETGGFPWWRNWLDRRIPNQTPEHPAMDPTNSSTLCKSIQANYSPLNNAGKANYSPLNNAGKANYSPLSNAGKANYSPLNNAGKANYSPLNNAGNVTPLSSTWNLSPSPITDRRRSYVANSASTPSKSSQKFAMSPLTKAKRSPIYGARTPQNDPSKNSKSSKPQGGDFSFDVPLKDDDSLMSCPSFSVPSYMAPTVSAKAKVRAQSNPKERTMASPSGGPKKRLSFHLPQSIGSLRWTKGSLFSGKDSSAQWMVSGSNKPIHSIGNLSVDSSLSLPAGVGMKSFK